MNKDNASFGFMKTFSKPNLKEPESPLKRILS